MDHYLDAIRQSKRLRHVNYSEAGHKMACNAHGLVWSRLAPQEPVCDNQTDIHTTVEAGVSLRLSEYDR